jgi:dihydroorotate dehydrogenase
MGLSLKNPLMASASPLTQCVDNLRRMEDAGIAAVVLHRTEDVLKSIMAGARVAMMTSALLENGIRHARRVLDELVRWMEEHEYESVEQMRGSMSHHSVSSPAAFERVNYMNVLSTSALRLRL